MLASYSSPILAAVFKCGLAKPNYLFFFTFTSLVECFVSPSARILQDAFYFLGSSFHNKLQLTTSVLSVIEASMILKCHDFADAFQIVRSVYTPSLSQPWPDFFSAISISYVVEVFCIYIICSVHYLKATFGPGNGDAVLEIPVSVTGSNKYLKFYYHISSAKMKLVVLQCKAGNTTVSKYTAKHSTEEWTDSNFLLDSDVNAIQFVAKKTGITTNVEYILVDQVEIISERDTGNTLLSHYKAVFQRGRWKCRTGKSRTGKWRTTT